MKKLIKLLVISIVSFCLFACSSKTESSKEVEVKENKKLQIGFVTDIGGIDDKSFNQTTYEGILKYAKENDLTVGEDLKYLQSKADTDYIPNLSAFVEEDRDLIVAAGYLFADSVSKVSEANPDQKMLIIDVDWLSEEKFPNLRQASFFEHEGSFLVGVAAGLKAKEAGKNVVGYITGQESVTMNKFEAGYQDGVWAVCPECQILRDNADSFQNAELGKTLAAKQYNAGAYVIYHAAGGTGNGVIQEAASRRNNGEDVWVIGVDTDQYEFGKYGNEGKSAVLTSMLKRVDVAAYNAVKDIADGKFTGGKISYSLKDGGVSIPVNNPNLNEEILKQIEEFKNKIISGEIKVRTEHTPANESDKIN